MNIKRSLTLLFSWESLLLLPILYFFSFTVVAANDYLLTEKDFTKHTGQIILFKKVDAINQKDKLSYGRGHSLILKIDKEPNKIFKIVIVSNSYYEKSLLNKLKLRDSITVFTSPRILNKGPYIIKKLAKQEKIIIPFSTKINKMENIKFLLISLFIFLGLSFIYYILLRRRYFRLNYID